jgi:hypothetical protein
VYSRDVVDDDDDDCADSENDWRRKWLPTDDANGWEMATKSCLQLLYIRWIVWYDFENGMDSVDYCFAS